MKQLSNQTPLPLFRTRQGEMMRFAGIGLILLGVIGLLLQSLIFNVPDGHQIIALIPIFGGLALAIGVMFVLKSEAKN